MAHKLHNYLRTYRKRSGLSQAEVAFLLGCKDGSMASRYERFRRQPPPETILAYEIIFGTPARELFAGLYQKVEEKTKRRAKLLARKLSAAKAAHTSPCKLDLLRKIASGPASAPAPRA
jgi:transcriptional regulator with XRE-family HTH domain